MQLHNRGGELEVINLAWIKFLVLLLRSCKLAVASVNRFESNGFSRGTSP